MYEAESWKMTKTIAKKSLRMIEGVYWHDRTATRKITEEIKRRRWIGHVLRLPPNCHSQSSTPLDREEDQKRLGRRTVQRDETLSHQLKSAHRVCDKDRMGTTTVT